MQQEAWRHPRGRRGRRQRRRPPRAPRAKPRESNSQCHLKKSWSSASAPCWWVSAVSCRGEEGWQKATVDRNKEFRICWKCTRPQDKLIAVPGTQCHCGKIHKRSFMLELTAALGWLHGLLEEEWWGGGGVRSVYRSVRGATKLHFDINTHSDLASKEELDFTG